MSNKNIPTEEDFKLMRRFTNAATNKFKAAELRFLQDKSTQEIARQLGTTSSVVNQDLANFRRRLLLLKSEGRTPHLATITPDTPIVDVGLSVRSENFLIYELSARAPAGMIKYENYHSTFSRAFTLKVLNTVWPFEVFHRTRAPNAGEKTRQEIQGAMAAAGLWPSYVETEIKKRPPKLSSAEVMAELAKGRISVAHLAVVLGQSISDVQSMVDDARIPFDVIDGRAFYKLRYVAKYLEGRNG